MAEGCAQRRRNIGAEDAPATSVFDDTRGRSPVIAPIAPEVAVADGPRPLICISPRWMPGHDQFSASQSVSDVEMEAIVAAGGMPVMMPITKDRDLIASYVELCDGFTLPGGHSVNPRRWGEEPRNPGELAPARDALEFPLIEMLIAADKPLFAICRGAQLLNVACGGTLSQYLYDMPPRQGMTHWRHSVILDRPAHPVEVAPDTLLSRITGGRSLIQVNSSHHDCVREVGRDLIVSGCATDGIIEAIEMPSKKFFLGVQWHPEYTWRSITTDFALWRAFIEASRENMADTDKSSAGACPEKSSLTEELPFNEKKSSARTHSGNKDRFSCVSST